MKKMTVQYYKGNNWDKEECNKEEDVFLQERVEQIRRSKKKNKKGIVNINKKYQGLTILMMKTAEPVFMKCF